VATHHVRAKYLTPVQPSAVVQVPYETGLSTQTSQEKTNTEILREMRVDRSPDVLLLTPRGQFDFLV
jgi:hypothetical protein